MDDASFDPWAVCLSYLRSSVTNELYGGAKISFVRQVNGLFMKYCIPIAGLMPGSQFCTGCWFDSNSGSIHLHPFRFSGCTDIIQLFNKVKHLLMKTLRLSRVKVTK